MERQLFDAVARSTLSSKVVDMIRDAITTGQLKPGERLKETDLADQMSVSRSPVREALRELEKEGLVVSTHGVGTYVIDLDAEDIIEIFTVRAALESLACELVIKDARLQPADFEHLERLIEQQREASGAGDFDRLTSLDTEFHEYICQKAGFERLLTMWQGLRSQMLALFNRSFRTQPDYVPQRVNAQHLAILDALRKGDAELLARLHREFNAEVAKEAIEIAHLQSKEQAS